MDSSSSQNSFESSDRGTTSPHHRQPPIETPLPQPVLCLKGCGFFGTEANLGFCSKCYKEEKPAACSSTSTSSRVPLLDEDIVISPTNPFPCFQQLASKKRKTCSTSDDHDHDHDQAQVSSNENHANEKKVKKRCRKCNKKVGLIEYKCKCGEIFCGMHRHPEEHSCGFDFKMAGKAVLAKENPLCIGDKLNYRA